MLTAYTPATVMLSSVEKIAFYLGISAGQGRVDGVNNDTDEERRNRRIIITWAQAISSSFQSYCNREFLTLERTQYFDVLASQRFFPAAVPVLSITSIKNDPLGQWQGSEWLLTDNNYHIGQTGNYIEMLTDGMMAGGQNACRIVYYGGLAHEATKSTFEVAGITGESNLTAGRYAYGTVSESIGKIVSYTSEAGDFGTLVLDNVYGIFQAGEPLKFQSTYQSQDMPGTGCTISSITRQSLCEAYPNLNRALEIELRYMQKHEGDFENHQDGGLKSGATRRSETESPDGYNFQIETRQILDQFKRIMVGP